MKRVVALYGAIGPIFIVRSPAAILVATAEMLEFADEKAAEGIQIRALPKAFSAFLAGALSPYAVGA